jgi:hypothetical protein
VVTKNHRFLEDVENGHFKGFSTGSLGKQREFSS